MKTIINKKGNTGYTVSGWNFTFSNKYLDRETKTYTANGTNFDAYDNRTNEFKKELRVAVRPVTVHSCGKKQMKLIAHDNGDDMRGINYDPNTQIFETAKDAEDYIANAWSEWMLDSLIKNCEHIIKMYSDDYYKKFKWTDERIAKQEQAIEMLKNGEIAIKFIYFTE